MNHMLKYSDDCFQERFTNVPEMSSMLAASLSYGNPLHTDLQIQLICS